MKIMQGNRVNMRQKANAVRQQIDWYTIIIPLAAVVFLGIIFMAYPEESSQILASIRKLLGDECGLYYAVLERV